MEFPSVDQVEVVPTVFDLAKCVHRIPIALGCSRCGTGQTIEDIEEEEKEEETTEHLLLVAYDKAGETEDDKETKADDPAKFGRSPPAALVMDDNMGTSPGPERAKQVMTSLNMGKMKASSLAKLEAIDGQRADGVKQGIQFVEAKMTLLTMWKTSGDKTNHDVSVLITTLARRIEKQTGRKIPQERLEGIARACKAGIKSAEKKRRLTRKEFTLYITDGFAKEGFTLNEVIVKRGKMKVG